MEQYQLIKLLGKGTYGKVFQATDTQTGEIKAIKRNRQTNEKEGVSCSSLREIALIKHLDHPNIVKLENVFVDDKQRICCVFEYIEQDLHVYHRSQQTELPIERAKFIIH